MALRPDGVAAAFGSRQSQQRPTKVLGKCSRVGRGRGVGAEEKNEAATIALPWQTFSQSVAEARQKAFALMQVGVSKSSSNTSVEVDAALVNIVACCVADLHDEMPPRPIGQDFACHVPKRVSRRDAGIRQVLKI